MIMILICTLIYNHTQNSREKNGREHAQNTLRPPQSAVENRTIKGFDKPRQKTNEENEGIIFPHRHSQDYRQN